MGRAAGAIMLLALSGVAASEATAQANPPRPWTEEKCVRYQGAYKAALARLTTRGLSPAFVAAHDRFLASGCLEHRDVCPVSPQEFALANELVLRGMSFGMASTFFPFACRDNRP